MNSPSGFSSIVSDAAILLGLKVASKDALMMALANVAAGVTGVPATTIVERVREREALGSTGFGLGAAIPHARIAGLSTVTAVVAQLAQGVDYGSLDHEPVDVAVLLLSPEDAGADHLKALARISRALRDPASLARLRAASDLSAMREAIAGKATGDCGKQAA